jgi:hypothetical protein
MNTKILDGKSARTWLIDAVGPHTNTVDFCSAYMKLTTVDHFISAYKRDKFGGGVRFLVRWKAIDLLMGSSDLEVYEYCKDREINFYIKEDFHGKIYQVNPGGILIGSFNLTSSGFSLKENPNDEAGVLLPSSDDNVSYIDSLFQSAIKVDDVLFEKMTTFVNANKSIVNNQLNWPADIQKLVCIKKQASKHLVNDFLFTKFDDFSNQKKIDPGLMHDLSLLGLRIVDLSDFSLISESLRGSVPYCWLKRVLNDNNGEIYFGALSEKLHNCLIDDPRPYRRDVKNLLQNLLSWTSKFCSSEIGIDQPNHSQRIKLLT